jgi:hypothetical protein
MIKPGMRPRKRPAVSFTDEGIALLSTFAQSPGAVFPGKIAGAGVGIRLLRRDPDGGVACEPPARKSWPFGRLISNLRSVGYKRRSAEATSETEHTLILSYILIVVLCLGIAGVSVSVLLQNYRDQVVKTRLDDMTRPIYVQIRDLLRGQKTLTEVWANVQEQAESNNTYILFVDDKGNISARHPG